MTNPRSKRVTPKEKTWKGALFQAVKFVPTPLDPAQDLKNSDPLDVNEEMMENVFDRDPESR